MGARVVGPGDRGGASAPSVEVAPRAQSVEALKVVTANLEYFEKRREQIRSAAFAEDVVNRQNT